MEWQQLAVGSTDLALLQPSPRVRAERTPGHDALWHDSCLLLYSNLLLPPFTIASAQCSSK